MSTVHVPDIPGPVERLCWKQGPLAQGMPRCDRKKRHGGLHSWEWVSLNVTMRQRHAAEVVKAIKFGFGFNASNADRAVEFYELEAECLAIWRQEEAVSAPRDGEAG